MAFLGRRGVHGGEGSEYHTFMERKGKGELMTYAFIDHLHNAKLICIEVGHEKGHNFHEQFNENFRFFSWFFSIRTIAR